jgi:D-threo-aldose 1-dehydrogenase
VRARGGVPQRRPYGGGILVKGPAAQPKYAYRPASEKVAAAVRAMQQACASCGVPLAAAALQFSVRDPRVTSTVVGVSEPSRIAEISELMTARIPDALWRHLDALAVPPELWLG